MPLYTFKCINCGNRVELIRSMKDTQYPQACSICGSVMGRDFKTDLPHAAKDYNHPIHSDALAISPTQRVEHERLFPDIKVDEACRPIFDNFASHEAYMKKCGIIKHPQKTKPKGKRIA